MAEIVVGARRINADGTRASGPEDRPRGEAGFDWVRVGDAVISSADDGLVSVKYEADGESFAMVTIRVLASSFRTVDSQAGIMLDLTGQ